MTNQHDPNWYKDNQDFIKDLCHKCFLRFADYCGICQECKKENLNR